MKTLEKFWLAAVSAAIVFSVVACSNSSGGGNTPGITVPVQNETQTPNNSNGQQTPEAAKEVTLTFDIDGTTTTLTGKAGETLTPPANPTKEGYVFACWNPTLPATFPNENTTYTATWRLEGDWAITYNLNGGTNAAENPAGYNIETPTITLAAPTKTGYIGTWYTTETFDAGTEITQIAQGTTGDITLWAKWEIDLLSNKFINGNFLEKTSEVAVITTAATVHMTDDSAWSGYYSGSDDRYKGVFIKGCAVTLSPYAMGRYEVTQELFEKVMGINPSSFTGSSASGETQKLRPVEQVNWYHAIAFCNKLSILCGLEPCYEVSGITDWANLPFARIPKSKSNTEWDAATWDFSKKGYRLPTEAEWEFAARGGDPSKPEWKYSYAGSNTEDPSKFTSGPYKDDALEAYAWYCSNSNTTHEVGTKKPNTLGLYDMSGNVFEWCWDWWSNTVDTTAVINPVGPTYKSRDRLRRGGSWIHYNIICTVSYRFTSISQGDCAHDLGFRLARSL